MIVVQNGWKHSPSIDEETLNHFIPVARIHNYSVYMTVWGYLCCHYGFSLYCTKMLSTSVWLVLLNKPVNFSAKQLPFIMWFIWFNPDKPNVVGAFGKTWFVFLTLWGYFLFPWGKPLINHTKLCFLTTYVFAYIDNYVCEYAWVLACGWVSIFRDKVSKHHCCLLSLFCLDAFGQSDTLKTFRPCLSRGTFWQVAR